MTHSLARARPGQIIVPTADLLAAADADLSATIDALHAEQQRRALEAGDPDAIAEECFDGAGFDYKGNPGNPYLVDGLLVCPGLKRDKSRTSHVCVFVSIDGQWSWEHPDRVFDDMQQVTHAGNTVARRAVTIVAAHDGMEIDVVTSKSTSGSACQMQTAKAYRVENGQLVHVGNRARPTTPNSHR